MSVGSLLSSLGSVVRKGANAGVGAVTSALGINGRENAEYQNEFTERMLRLQRDWALADRDYNNKYNSPSAQRLRWEEAGINPFMALGQMDAGSSTMQTTPSSVSSADPNNSSIASLVNTGISSLVSFPVNVAQAKNLNASSNLTSLQAEQQRIDNKYRSQQHEAQIENLRRQGKLTLSQYYAQKLANKMQTELYDDSVSQYKAATKEANARASAQEALAEQEAYRSDMAKELLDQARAETGFQAQRFAAELQVMASQVKMNNAASVASYAVAAESVARKLGIQWDNSLKARTINYAVRMHQAQAKEAESREYIANATKDYEIRASKYQARQVKLDYYNPFNYIGRALGGGINVSKAIK